MAGALYIWIMLGFFLLTVGLILLLAGMFWLGHLIEKKETGAKHGFLELPEELRQSPPSPAADKTEPAPNQPLPTERPPASAPSRSADTEREML